jgi:hypothetical protein
MDMDVHALVLEALKLTSAGLGMVFAVLAVFFGLVKALMFLFPIKKDHDTSSE